MIRAGSIVLGLLILILVWGSRPVTPRLEMIEKAVVFQLQQSQAELDRGLFATLSQPIRVHLHRLVVREQHQTLIAGLPAYEIQGSFDASVQSSHGKIIHHNVPFDLTLQQQVEGKSWRLVWLDADEQLRFSDPLY